MIKIINKEEFKEVVFDYSTQKEFVFNKNTPVILNFFAVWCGPCRAFGPTLEQIQMDYGDKVRVIKVDVDESNEIANIFNVRGVPTTYFLNSQSAPFSLSGNIPKESVEKVIAELFKISKK